jgi:hypothetical protein
MTVENTLAYFTHNVRDEDKKVSRHENLESLVHQLLLQLML